MKKIGLAVASAALLCGSVSLGLAQGHGAGTTAGETPGHEMQENGSKPGGPGGASSYAPGHQDRDDMKMGKDRDDTRGLHNQARDKDLDRTRDRDDMKMGKDRDDMRGLHNQARDKDLDRTRDRDDMKMGKDRDDMRDLHNQARDKDLDRTRDRDDMKFKKDRDDTKRDIR